LNEILLKNKNIEKLNLVGKILKKNKKKENKGLRKGLEKLKDGINQSLKVLDLSCKNFIKLNFSI
jgi:hypothetical protein